MKRALLLLTILPLIAISGHEAARHGLMPVTAIGAFPITAALRRRP